MPLPNPGMNFTPFTPLPANDLNDMVENIESLADGTGIDNGSIPASAVDFSTGIWWEEIGRSTLSVAGDTITVSSLPQREYLHVVISVIATGGTVNTYFRFNGDTGLNYAERLYDDGVSTTSVSQDKGLLAGQTVQQNTFGILDIWNIATQEKFGRLQGNRSGASGGANAPVGFRTASFKWANTSSAITSITILNSGGTGDFGIGSRVIVLGHN